MWIRLKTTKVFESGTLQLKREGITRIEITNLKSQIDTLVVDEGLLPKREYRYKAYRVEGGVAIDSSMELVVTTMDTTSHNFSWEITQLGTHSSVLYDVAIVNDTLIYAVGEIFHSDSAQAYTFFNLAVWNGRSWTLRRLYYQGGIASIRSVYLINSNDIWFDPWFRWNGQSIVEMPIDPIFYGNRVYKMWGSSSNNVYAVGTSGLIAHYNGQTWRRLEIPSTSGQGGTELDIYDIWGAKNSKTGEYEIYAVAAKQFVTFEKRIYKISGGQVTTVSAEGIPYSLHGIWFKPGRKYYVAGSGFYSKSNINNSDGWKWLHPGISNYYIYAIRGNDVNDIFACGSFGELLHFNGYTWKSYRDIVGISYGAYREIFVKGNTVVAVGYESPIATVAIGKRQ